MTTPTPTDGTIHREDPVNRTTDPVSLVFALAFLGLGALGLAAGALDLGGIDRRLWPMALVLLGVAGLATTLATARRSTRTATGDDDGGDDDHGDDGGHGAAPDPGGPGWGGGATSH